MRQIFRIGILLSALLIFVTGCGSKEWIQGLWEKKGGQADQRQEGEFTTAEFPEQGPERAAPASREVGREIAPRGYVQVFHIYFSFDAWELDGTAHTDLQALIGQLRENPGLTVDLEGYADSTGSREYNLALSQKRVEVVRRYLTQQGVEPLRIRSVGLGQLTDGGTPADRAKSRRVTVRLTVASD